MPLEVLPHDPQHGSKSTPILFVHGAWHGAWCWEEHFLPYFATQGYSAYALSLRGHSGSPNNKSLRWTSVNDYVADVAQVADELEVTHKTRPIIVGHSMGGYVVQKYLENHNAPAAVLLASIPAGGALLPLLRAFIRHPLPILKTMLTLTMYHAVGTLELCKESFFSANMPDEQVRSYFQRMQDESFRVIVLESALLNLPRPQQIKTPLLVLGGTNDTIFKPSEVEATARAYHTQATIFQDTAHDIMLEANWQLAADKILSWLGERNL